MPLILINTGIVLLGAGAGFLYYKLVGCKSGVCPLTSTPVGSILTGAAIALLYVTGSK